MCNYLAYFQFAQRQKGKPSAEGDTDTDGVRRMAYDVRRWEIRAQGVISVHKLAPFRRGSGDPGVADNLITAGMWRGGA